MPVSMNRIPLIRRFMPGTLLCVICSTAIAQSPGLDNQENFRTHIKKTQATITLDGDLQEDGWQMAEVALAQWNWIPKDIGTPKRKLEMRACYNDEHIYFSFTGYDDGPDIIKTLKRDTEIGGSDGVGLVLDPLNEHLNGYVFIIHPSNVQGDDIISSGGIIEVDWSWDTKWYSETRRYPDKWILEIAIPFKTLRYAKDKTEWGINFGQGDISNNEYSVWAKLPPNKFFVDLGFTGKLIWDAPPPPMQRNIAFIPYVKTSVNQGQENSTVKVKPNAGFDTKIGLSSSMNLDLTVNPDFSQVDVDKQVTNLTRFDILFPEKRTFFLENADLFSGFGSKEIKPFYSRRIGLDNNGNAIPIIAGAKLTGNINNKTRLGVMNMQTQKKNNFSAQNYYAVAFTRRLLARSVLRGYFLNRQAFMDEAQKKKSPLDVFARNAGMEFDFFDKKGLFSTWGGYHTSFKNDIHAHNNYLLAAAGYFGRNLNLSVVYEYAGTNYYTDMGFVQRIFNYDAANDTIHRVGFRQITNPNKYTIYPKKGKINQHVFELNNKFVNNPDGSFNERKHELIYTINFASTSSILVNSTYQRSALLFPVKFSGDANALPLPAKLYQFMIYKVKCTTDIRKPFYVIAGIQAGEFYSGKIFQPAMSWYFRRQPWGRFSLEAEYTRLEFAEQYGEADLWLIGSQVELGFSTKVFWTTFFQYNTLQNNFNINSRFQWRFKPMSDIFVVYTDNYFTDPFFKYKNRGVVIKMNWWLTL